MKKIPLLILLFCLAGCASVPIPNYIHDKYPYEKTFFVSFKEAKQAVTDALEVTGWIIERESEPALFERERDITGEREQTLLFSRVRQTSFFIGTNYARVNAYIREVAERETEVELRYTRVSSVIFKNFTKYRNDRAVDHIFKEIEAQLNAAGGE